MNERLKELRTHLGLTQSAFAERLGVTKATISRLEQKEREITNQMYRAICREFRVNEEWFRSGKGEMFHQIESEKEITEWFYDVMNVSNKKEYAFIHDLIKALSRLDYDDWKTLEKIATKMK